MPITIDHPDYIKHIKPNYIPAHRRKTPQGKATEEDMAKFKSFVQQLAWPARSIMPEL